MVHRQRGPKTSFTRRSPVRQSTKRVGYKRRGNEEHSGLFDAYKAVHTSTWYVPAVKRSREYTFRTFLPSSQKLVGLSPPESLASL